jgi:hypothetical protein
MVFVPVAATNADNLYPVQLVSVPDEGVPNAGVTNVGELVIATSVPLPDIVYSPTTPALL